MQDQLPKLKLEYGKVDLKDALTDLGMSVVFDSQSADLNRIANVSLEHLFIAFVDYKAVIEINKKETEGVAVTNIGIFIISVPVRHSSL